MTDEFEQLRTAVEDWDGESVYDYAEDIRRLSDYCKENSLSFSDAAPSTDRTKHAYRIAEDVQLRHPVRIWAADSNGNALIGDFIPELRVVPIDILESCAT